MKINVELYRDGSNVLNDVNMKQYREQLISTFPNIASLDALENSSEFKQLSFDADRWKALINWLLNQTSENLRPNTHWSKCEKIFENKIEIDQQELQLIAEGKNEETIAEQLYSNCNLEEVIKKVFTEHSSSKETIYLDTLALGELERRAGVKDGKASDLDAYIHWNIANARLNLMALRTGQEDNQYKIYADNLTDILLSIQIKGELLTSDEVKQKQVLEKSIGIGGFLEAAKENISEWHENKNQRPSVNKIYQSTKAAETVNLASTNLERIKKRKPYAKLAIAVYFIITLIGLIAIASILLASHGLATPILAPLGWGLMNLANANAALAIFASLLGVSLFGGIAEIIRPESAKRFREALFIALPQKICQTLTKIAESPVYKKAIYPFAYVKGLIFTLLWFAAHALQLCLSTITKATYDSASWIAKQFGEGVAWAGERLKNSKGFFSRNRVVSADSFEPPKRLLESSKNNILLYNSESVEKIQTINKIIELLNFIEKEKANKAEKERSASRFNQFVSDFEFESILYINNTARDKEQYAKDNVQNLIRYQDKAKELHQNENKKLIKENARFKQLLSILEGESEEVATSVPSQIVESVSLISQ